MISLDWEFLANARFWVLAVLALCIGVGVGLVLSGNLPEVIDLTESQEQAIIEKQVRACDREVDNLRKGFVDGLDRCFGRNQELIDEFSEEIDDLEASVVGKIEDLNSSITDLNESVSDWNCR